ncbi:hypothetical protein [Clostridium botulinum]
MKVVVIGGGWAGCAVQLKLMLYKKQKDLSYKREISLLFNM